MKVGKNYFEENKSSFLSVDKDLSLIVNKLLTNDKLCKLLYYTQMDCLKAENLTMAQKIQMLHHQIKIVPKIQITTDCPIQVLIRMDGFVPNSKNPQFRDCVIVFHILCHPDHWNLGDFALRPYKIAGEIDAMLNEQKFSGIGTLQFLECNDLTLNDDLIGITLGYAAIHGVEDNINPLT